MGGGCELRPAAAAAGRAREERRARAEGLDPRGIGSQVCTKLATVCTAIPRCPKTRARSMASSPPASREGAGRGGPPPTPPTQFEGHAGPPSLSSLCCASSSVPSAFQTNPSAGSIGGAARVFVWGGGGGVPGYWDRLRLRLVPLPGSVCAWREEGGNRSGSRLGCGMRDEGWGGGESRARTFLPRE